MKSPLFIGSAVAIITPFNDNGVDYDTLGDLIEFQIKNSTDAIVICGTTGEASTMPDQEHIAVVKFTVDKVNKRVPVIAGSGSNDTRHAIKLAQELEKAGADALLAVTPYYNKATQKGLYQHFVMTAESVKIPIILYNVPGRTNLNINPETMQELAKINNIIGVKECNFEQIGEIINLCGPDFAIYSGEDSMVLPYLSMGAKGVISVMANVIPQDTHDMVMKFLAGDVNIAMATQLKVLNLVKMLFCEVNPIPVKAAVGLMGYKVGDCRMPLTNLEGEKLTKLEAEMKNYGIL